MKYHGVGWNSNLEEMLTHVPKKHHVQKCKKKLKTRIDDLSIMISLWNNSLSNRTWSIYDSYHHIKRILKL